MNKKISLVFAGAAIAGVALAGCHSGTAVSSSSVKAQITSSAVKSEAAAAGKAVLSTCIPAEDITKTYLISLAEKPSAAKALATRCGIPEGKRAAFVKAVLASAGNAYFRGSFKTPEGQRTWADQVFPVILRTYQSK